MKSCPWLVTCCIRFAPDPVESSLSTASVACLYFCPVTQYAMPRTEVGHYASSLDVQTQQMQDVKWQKTRNHTFITHLVDNDSRRGQRAVVLPDEHMTQSIGGCDARVWVLCKQL